MPSPTRLQRIADRIRQELADMLLRDLDDPRLNAVYVTDVKIDRELSYADIYLSALEGSPRSPEIMAGVSSASGFIRKELAARVALRSFPRLRFHWDPTPESADRIERKLVELHQRPRGGS